ncbi:uncharacterized protein MONBRDRAFT_33298 [Monosiga brevicollis MX1]|uniref:Mitochondrial escape protein 2 C-terminal domain-containing protein n=1 Tax=Monosiga brevicollis TaxID=81824 RepID=A9V4L8_MONBE|nr:uncharacterized protein MONBRDRAFT_33298 [Monosiga brevicollis MX1]EDQ87476.1 predicted protein [Monosiga brevicollis MX1]|eukprot:XP_001747736.1 hypothetical protein [Monosiga brevicollis MX1]
MRPGLQAGRAWSARVPVHTALARRWIQRSSRQRTAATPPEPKPQTPLNEPPPPAASRPKSNDMDVEVVEKLHRGVLWLSNLHPIKLNRIDVRHKLYDMAYVDETLKRMIEKMDQRHAIEIERIVHRSPEGGVFIHFKSSQYDAKGAADIIRQHLMDKRKASFLLKEKIRAHLVMGKPFLHDMEAYPTRTIRVDFKGPAMDMEELYNVLRPYGHLNSVNIAKNSEGIRYGTASYNKIHGSIGASNCLHRAVMQDTKLLISYEKYLKPSALREFWNNYSRVLLPTLLSATVAFAYTMFDPLREFFVYNHITNRFLLSPESKFGEEPDFVLNTTGPQEEATANKPAMGGIELRLYNAVKSQALDLVQRVSNIFGSSSSDQVPVWSKEALEQLRQKVATSSNSDEVIMLAGPLHHAQGCGKTTIMRALVREEGITNLLHLDFRRADTFVSDAELLKRLKQAVGYKPSLTVLYKLQRMIEELLAVSTRGVVAPQASTEAHVRQVLDCVSKVLQSLRKWNSKSNGNAKAVTPTSNGPATTTPARSASDMPLIVLNGLDSVFLNDHPAFAQQLMDWAFTVSHERLATVVLLCDENIAEDYAEETRVQTAVLQVEDASAEQAKNFMQLNLPHVEVTDQQIAAVSGVLGGRLSDINELVRRVEFLHQPMAEALNDMVSKAVSFVAGHALTTRPKTDAHWTLQQAWKLVSQLAEDEEIPFERMLYSDTFNGDDTALYAMQRARLIRIQHRSVPVEAPPVSRSWLASSQPKADDEAIPVYRQQLFIQPARPLFREAFRRIVHDATLSDGIRLQLLKEEAGKLLKTMHATEEELDKVLDMLTEARGGHVTSVIKQLVHRADQLAATLEKTVNKIEQVEAAKKSLAALML